MFKKKSQIMVKNIFSEIKKIIHLQEEKQGYCPRLYSFYISNLYLLFLIVTLKKIIHLKGKRKILKIISEIEQLMFNNHLFHNHLILNTLTESSVCIPSLLFCDYNIYPCRLKLFLFLSQ